jgi:phosphoglycolate phosphatase
MHQLSIGDSSTQKLFLFDFDGVVADSLEFYAAFMNRCLLEIGEEPFSRHDFLEIFEENFYEGIARKGIDVLIYTATSANLARTLDYSTVAPVKKIAPVLEALMNDHILGIISSNSHYAIGRLLAEFGYERYFKNILGQDFMLSKVDKICHATEQFKAGRDRTFYIGDTVGDIREAKQAGVGTVAVTWGWHSREKLESASPDYLIDDPEEILQI